MAAAAAARRLPGRHRAGLVRCRAGRARARAFFAGEYSDMRDEATRIGQARSAGYELLGSFRLPADDWHAYYAGLEEPLRDAISRRGEHEIYAATRLEREIYEAYGDEYGYLCLALQVVAEQT